MLDASLSVTVGDGVSFTLTVTNAGRESTTVTFRDRLYADFTVREADGGEEVWRRSDDRMSAQVLSTAEFAPGETATFDAAWPDPIPGEYTVVGELRLVDGTVRTETPFSV